MADTFTPLSKHPDFIPCRVGDVLTPEQERAALPGLDTVLREIARGVADSQRKPVSDDVQDAG